MAPKISLLSVMVTCVAWLTSLSVIALVPIDVYSTLADIAVPALDILWSVSYWCVCACVGRERGEGCGRGSPFGPPTVGR